MKARIKETGEIVTLRNMYADGTAMDTNGFYYHQGDISEFIEESNQPPIDWEQRRYEIAKDLLISSYATPMGGISIQSYVHGCVQVADILIEELKKEKEESSHGLEALAVKKAEDLIIALQQPRDLDKFGRIIEQAPYLYKLLEEIATVPKLCTSREFHSFYNEVTTRVREALEKCNLNYPEIR